MNIKILSMLNNDINRKVFRKKLSKKNISLWKLFIEALLLSTIGTFLLVFVNGFSRKFNWENIFTKSWNDLAEGSYHIFQSLYGYGSILLSFLSIFIGIIFLVCGCIRVIRFCYYFRVYLIQGKRLTIRRRRL